MKRIILSLFVLFSLIGTYAQGISLLQQRKLGQALSAISGMYVDSIKDTKLVESAIKGALENLDPHSVYISKDEVQSMREPLEGNFEGIGIEFQILKDTINVVQTISGAPAEKVGVLPGDKIIFIGNDKVAGVKVQNSDVFKRLRGNKGTPVFIKVRRGNQSDLIEFKIIRDKIPIYSVNVYYMVTDKIGYIKVNTFGQTTAEEFKKALRTLKSKGMKDLIVDLQGNGGGFLKTAIDLADEFLSNNKLIVYTQGLNSSRQEARATSVGDFENGRLVVLIDEYSASASEIVSGALQDWDRAVLIGRRSFGKGLVQREIDLVDGSLIRLTIARYYTPTGRCIQKSYKNGTKDYNLELMNRYNHGEFMHADSVHFSDSLKYKTLVNKRTVYGGGGIMPDIFVPLDTTEYSDYHRNLVGKGVINSTVMDYLNSNRDELKKKYTTFDAFRKGFEVNDDFLKNLQENATKEKIPLNEKQYNNSLRIIKLQLKSLIARDLWGDNEASQILDIENKPLQKAIELFQSKTGYEDVLKSVGTNSSDNKSNK